MKINDLKHFLINSEILPDIIALQETHLIAKYVPKIPEYSLVRKDRDVRGGGVCMFLKNNIPFTEIEVNSKRPIEAQCVVIQDLQIFNVYIPPCADVEGSALSSLLVASEPRTIIIGDFNAHPSDVA